MNIKKDDIKTFIYEGNDKMIDFENVGIPHPHPDFVVQLRLQNDKLITAPSGWRERIWCWWYINRKNEVTDNILLQVSRSLQGKPPLLKEIKDDK